MLRYLLLLILVAIVARAFWRVVDGVAEGMRGAAPTGRTPVAGVGSCHASPFNHLWLCQQWLDGL